MVIHTKGSKRSLEVTGLAGRQGLKWDSILGTLGIRLLIEIT